MDTAMCIFLVEDDEILAGEIEQFLKKWGYQTAVARNFQNILSEFTLYHPHLILLDINLPYYDGFYWCSQIRQISDVPIIYISSRSDDKDKIMGMAQGGDDYIEKPFHLELLKAKIEAILRRTYQYKTKDRIPFKNGMYFEENTASLFYKEQEVDLTKSEKRIMKKLLERKPYIVTREELMVELWNTDEFVSDGTLTTIICRLRNKLKAVCGEEIIATKKGQGYFIPVL